jgi:hypothetical protein
MAGKNESKLRAAGFTFKANATKNYIAKIEELTDNQVKALVDAKTKLDKALEPMGGTPEEHYTKYVVPL